MPYAKLRTYWRRYMGFTMAWCFLRGRAKVLRSRAALARLRNAGSKRTYGQKLLDEHDAYYSKVPLARAPPGKLKGVEKFRLVHDQRARKRQWHEYNTRLRKDMQA